jgi:hypothetical protein
MLLKRSLRSGSPSVQHSLNHRAPEDRSIPGGTWQRARGRLIRGLNEPESAQSYLGKIEAALLSGLAALDEAVAVAVLEIKMAGSPCGARRPRPKTPDWSRCGARCSDGWIRRSYQMSWSRLIARDVSPGLCWVPPRPNLVGGAFCVAGSASRILESGRVAERCSRVRKPRAGCEIKPSRN